MTNIYCNGCSFVMGQELNSSDPLDMKNMKTAFPAQIGAVNDAWSGSSTQNIFNRTIDYCNNNPVIDTVIIGWTHVARTLTTPPNWANGNHYRIDRMDSFAWKPLSGNTWSTYYGNLQALKRSQETLIECLHELLTSRGIKVVHFKSFDIELNPRVPMLWHGQNWNKMYKSYCNHNSLPGPKDPNAHPEQKQHDWLANYLRGYLNNEQTEDLPYE